MRVMPAEGKDTANAVAGLLHRTDWGFVGAVATIAGIVVAIIMGVVLHLKSRHRKRLSFRPITTSLVAVDKKHSKRIEIRYDGHLVTDLSLVRLAIKNIGNVTILPQEFQEPIRITFGRSARVLSWEVARAWREGLAPKISPLVPENGTTEADEVSVIEVQPLLLNEGKGGDGMVLQFLVERLGEVRVIARIAGLAEVERDTSDPDSPILPALLRAIDPFPTVTHFLLGKVGRKRA